VPPVVYDKIGDKDVNIYNVDLIVGNNTGVVDKQPNSDNHIAHQNGGVDLVHRQKDESSSPNTTDGTVIHSVEELSPRTIPVKDMELSIMKGGVSSECVVMDNMDDGRILNNVRTKSIEFDIKQDTPNVDF
jgi:hypothetical protein